MGLYEQWNPLLFVIHPQLTQPMQLLERAVNGAFSAGKLDIGPLRSGYASGIAWGVSSDSAVNHYRSDRHTLERELKKFSDTAATDAALVKYFTGGGGWWSRANLIDRISDEKLVISFQLPNVSPGQVNKLVEVYVNHGLAQDKGMVITDADHSQPYNYIATGMSIQQSRAAARIVNQFHYSSPVAEAIWLSAERQGSKSLYEHRDVTVELRVSPAQPLMKIAQTAVEMGYALAGKEADRKKIFLDLWHMIVLEMISPDLVRNTRLPGQQAIYNSILTHTVLPYLDPDYARANQFHPYNSIVFGARGVGKSMLAAMFALTRFKGGVVVPISQDALADKNLGLMRLLSHVRQELGVYFIPLIEDIDKIGSLPSRREGPHMVEQTITQSDIANLLAGIGKDRPVLIGTGNDPEMMDPNILELERLGGNMHHLQLPNTKERKLLIENLVHGRQAAGNNLDSLVSQLVKGTDGFSHRMIADVVQRTVPLSAESRIKGVPAYTDFEGRVEPISDTTVQAALNYAKTHYQFEDLRQREASISDFFQRKIGEKSNKKN